MELKKELKHVEHQQPIHHFKRGDHEDLTTPNHHESSSQ
jgi:hypothetical protein